MTSLAFALSCAALAVALVNVALVARWHSRRRHDPPRWYVPLEGAQPTVRRLPRGDR